MAARFVRWLLCIFGVILIGFLLVYFLSAPSRLPKREWANFGKPDVQHGEQVFWAGGCASCHAAAGAEGDALKVLSGGLALKTPFGTFHAPNISPDETAGIGSWKLSEFGNAMKRGIGKDGENLYPAFPYGSYARMSDKDVVDLYAFLRTLPKSTNVAPPHELRFPYNIRAGLTLWKWLYLNDLPRVDLPEANDKVRRGQYLVESLGHCGECHTPRDQFGGLIEDKWLAGAPNPSGQGTIPDITPGSKQIGTWSESDIANYLETGFTPDYDSAGGDMAEVQKNIAHLPKSDLEAIAAYLKAIPAR